MYVCVYIYIYMYRREMRVYKCVYIYIYIHKYIYIYIRVRRGSEGKRTKGGEEDKDGAVAWEVGGISFVEVVLFEGSSSIKPRPCFSRMYQ